MAQTAMGRLATADELEGYKPVDALKALARAAAGVQVVMINEAHHVPQHRAFTLALLKLAASQRLHALRHRDALRNGYAAQRARLSDGANRLLHRRNRFMPS